MEFHRIAPQRPCDIWTYSDFEPGPASERRFRRMVFAYDFPTEDCLFKDPPYYFVTEQVGAALVALHFTGASLRSIDTRVSEAYVQCYGTPTVIPRVEQLVVTGIGG